MKKQLNVLFLCSWYPSRILPTNGDFIERHAQTVALKNKVTVFHIITDKNLETEIEITQSNTKNVQVFIAYVKPTNNKISKAFLFKKAQQQLLAKIKIDTIDIAHVNKLFPMGLFALNLKRKHKIPFIITEHHSIYKKPLVNTIGFFEKRMSRKIAKQAAYICPVSTNLGKHMQQFDLKGNYLTIPNVVNTKLFLPKEKKKTTFNLLHVSNMVALKNVKGILKVIKSLENTIPNLHCTIVGANAKEYQKHATLLKIKNNVINFVNQVPHTELIKYYQNASAFVLFSDTENQPCVIPEAFSCGTPVIATNVGGIPEYFPKGFGILIEPQQEKQLKNAIFSIYKDYKAISPKKMHQYATSNFGANAISKVFTEVYNKTLSK